MKFFIILASFVFVQQCRAYIEQTYRNPTTLRCNKGHILDIESAVLHRDCSSLWTTKWCEDNIRDKIKDSCYNLNKCTLPSLGASSNYYVIAHGCVKKSLPVKDKKFEMKVEIGGAKKYHLKCPFQYYIKIKSAKFIYDDVGSFLDRPEYNRTEQFSQLFNGYIEKYGSFWSPLWQNFDGYNVKIEYSCVGDQIINFVDNNLIKSFNFNEETLATDMTYCKTRNKYYIKYMRQKRNSDDDADSDDNRCLADRLCALRFDDAIRRALSTLTTYNHDVVRIITHGGYMAEGHNYVTPIIERVFHRVTHRIDGQPIDLPRYVQAVITHNDLRSRSSYNQSRINNAMARMDKIGARWDGGQGDENGHLLAASLGGTNEVTNFVPQSFRQNRRDMWNNMERYMRWFLQRNQQSGSINWQLAIFYHPQLASYRPIAFCVEMTATDDNGVNTNIQFCIDNENESDYDDDYANRIQMHCRYLRDFYG